MVTMSASDLSNGSLYAMVLIDWPATRYPQQGEIDYSLVVYKLRERLPTYESLYLLGESLEI